MTDRTDEPARHAWRQFLLRIGLVGLALHASALATAGATRGPGPTRVVLMVGAACFVMSVWAGLRPLTSARTPWCIVEAIGTALLAVAFALLLGWSAANAP